MNYLKDIYELSFMIKHLPGRHDQSTHGRRFKIPGDRASKIVKGPKFSEEKFPSQKQFESANLKEFTGGKSATVFSTIIGTEKYFVKLSMTGDDANEVVASKMGKDIGIEDMIVPMKIMKKGFNDYLVAPWTTMQQFGKTDNEFVKKAVLKLSDEEYTKLHAYEYLMNDSDRHKGNNLIDPITGKIKVIDMGYAFDADQGNFQAKWSALDKIRSVDGDTKNNKLDIKTLKEVSEKTISFEKDMKDAGISPNKISAMNRRISVLKKVVAKASKYDKYTTVGILNAYDISS